jgi:hypothetical protein
MPEGPEITVLPDAGNHHILIRCRLIRRQIIRREPNRGNIMRTLLAGSLALAAAVTTAAAANLEPKDIQTTFFNGQPFTSSTPAGVKFKMIFTPDGMMTREPVGKTGQKGEGTWKLSKDGFCTTWKGSPGNCFRLVTAGDNKWSVLKSTSIVGTWSK